MIEFKQDYKLHAWYAMGHMAEAEAELIRDHEEQAIMIRTERTKLQDALDRKDKYEIDFEYLIRSLIEYDEELTKEQLEGLSV